MRHYVVLFGITTAMLLSGCNAAGVQPSATSPDPHSSEGRAEIAAALTAETGSQPPLAVTQGDMSQSLQTQLDQISGRITLLQEQMIQVRSLSQQVLDQSQLQASRLQQFHASGPSAAGFAEVDTQYLEQAVAEIDGAIAQLLAAMSMQNPDQAVMAPYRISTAYTRNGWILIRYHAETGETWLADKNVWQPLRDPSSLRASQYEVQVQRADGDRKGFVAVRIDRRDGRSWWLNDETWQALD
ncbi:hypothetical protein [Nitrincola tapanii]|uniref:Uncharacterized protein n=1 Tax=Nitrincola tapanii TaxID=1708751 RepID=A0A5A9W379_9GAMM|nr:hypothetical protein [Nitrincola tapanii]KAA0875052.1 hypothetical protein E1H14_06430 [Nitrincola tapanii]